MQLTKFNYITQQAYFHLFWLEKERFSMNNLMPLVTEAFKFKDKKLI